VISGGREIVGSYTEKKKSQVRSFREMGSWDGNVVFGKHSLFNIKKDN
jgi:hypothetical protein